MSTYLGIVGKCFFLIVGAEGGGGGWLRYKKNLNHFTEQIQVLHASFYLNYTLLFFIFYELFYFFFTNYHQILSCSRTYPLSPHEFFYSNFY